MDTVKGRAGADALVLAPLHLRSLTEIAATFRRRKETVKRWQGQGAPIAVDEGHYCAEYNALMHWLVQRGGAHPVKPS